MMRFPVWLTIVVALVVTAGVLLVGKAMLQPNLPLIVEAGFSLDEITPNADGDKDIATFEYTITRTAEVSLLFEAEDGTVFVFREDEPRFADDYRVEFSGVVDGYTLPGEDIPGEVERRLIPDGVYTWRLIAKDINSGEIEERSGTIAVRDADSPLPLISVFDISPPVFTPNQDSISDRVQVHVYLEKDADLQVYLLDDAGVRYPISARKEGRQPNEAGRHIFDYEGGVDLGADPPPDGTYTVVAIAQDAVGQRIRRTSQVTIAQGGKPRAEILRQAVGVDVVFEVWPYDERYYTTEDHPGELIPEPSDPSTLISTDITVPLGDMLVFKLTVENYGDVPIRTTGPAPGTVYNQNQVAAATGFYDESGAWRVGIECDTSSTSYPYRWAVASDDQLIEVEDPSTGNIYKYLPPGERAVVWGAIRLTEIKARNPQNCWAGLIHEDVAVVNSVVGLRSVEIVAPDGE